MRYLIVSDPHSNWEALGAVLADAAGQYDSIVCCGDLAGYGPDPNRVIEWARANVHAVVRGNHDRACAGMEDLEWFNPVARTATIWTMAQLTTDNLEYLRRLPQGPVILDGFQLVHGSPLDEDEYVTSVESARNVFSYLESNVTFFGHTHLQGGFEWIGGRYKSIQRPKAWQSELQFRLDPDAAYLINPGSVGQPRDGDPRAAYALFDTSSRDVALHRIAYDSETTSRKIQSSGLPGVLAARLALGQ